MPRMCVTVVVVGAMSVVGGGSTTAIVEEASMAAAEEANTIGRAGDGCAVYCHKPVIHHTVQGTFGTSD
jgi:hypothetical protein